MPSLFKVVEAPATCYPKEVAYWLALGRVPDCFYGDNGVDQRMGDWTRDTGEMVVDSEFGFTELEFRSFGVQLDYGRYLRVRGFNSEHDLDNYIKEWEERLARMADANNEQREIWNGIVGDAEEGRWALQMEQVFEPVIDRARALVFEALSSGKLTCQGWLANVSAGGAPDDEPSGEFVDIEPNLWTARRFDWDQCSLDTVCGKTFLAVQVRTEDMLVLFPRPLSDSVAVLTFDCFPGGAAIAQEDSRTPAHSESVVRKGRGRPPQMGSIKDAIRNYLADKYKNQELPKKESLIADGQAAAELLFGRKYSRSTVQWWLNGFIPGRLETAMPKIHANNSSKIAAE